MGNIKPQVLEFLGEEQRFIQQEFMGGVIIPKTSETEQFFGADEDFGIDPGDNFILTHYWFGLGEDFDKIVGTPHYRDEIVYTIIDRGMDL